MYKLALVQCVCPHYRVPFFQKLAKKIDLFLFYGKGEKNGSWQNSKNINGFKHKKLFSLILRFPVNNFMVRLVWFPTLLCKLRKFRPEVVISEGFTNMINNIFVWFYTKIFSVSWIIWDSGRNKEKPMNLLRRSTELLNIFLLKRASAVIAYGSFAKDYLISVGINPEKIFIAQNTIDVETCFKDMKKLKFNPSIIEQVRQKLNLNNKKVILYVGSLEKRKRVHNLITVYNNLKGKIPNISLLIIGDGPYESKLRALVISKHVEDVHFLGRITTDKGKYLLLCDVFVQPGWNSLAIIEAMAYGKPVVTVSHGGPEYELIKNKKTGFIVDRNNLTELEDRILDILRNKIIKKETEKEMQQIVRKYSIDNMVNKFLATINYGRRK